MDLGYDVIVTITGIVLVFLILVLLMARRSRPASPATLWQPSWQPSTLWATASMC